MRKSYGNFTLVIQISKQLIDYYSNKLNSKEHHFSQILSVKPAYLVDDEDLIYCLALHFIKGYVDVKTGEFHPNTDFNPVKKLQIFKTNLDKLIVQDYLS